MLRLLTALAMQVVDTVIMTTMSPFLCVRRDLHGHKHSSKQGLMAAVPLTNETPDGQAMHSALHSTWFASFSFFFLPDPAFFRVVIDAQLLPFFTVFAFFQYLSRPRTAIIPDPHDAVV